MNIQEVERRARLAVLHLLDETDCVEVKLRLPTALYAAYVDRDGLGDELSDFALSAFLSSPGCMVMSMSRPELQRLRELYSSAVRGAILRCADSMERRP